MLYIYGDANAHNNITAQFVSQSGTLVGPRISLGRTGGAPFVAFDGTNYLMVWPDDFRRPKDLYGQFISKSGALVGNPFLVTTATDDGGVRGLVFGGTKYFVTYVYPSASRQYGRFIETNGTVGSEITISTGNVTLESTNNVAFDGTNYLVVWINDANHSEVRGRLVSPSGTLGAEFTINASLYYSENPLTVAFDGTNYLVVWSDEVGGVNSGEYDLFGQLVDTSGNLAGGPITITSAPGGPILPFIAFDGTNYLVTWTDLLNDINRDGVCDSGEGTCWDIYGQFISPAGTLIGSEIPISTDSGNEIGGVVGFDGGKHFVIVNTGVAPEREVFRKFFSDVPEGYWAKEYINAIYSYGITTGYAQDDPNTPENERRYGPEDPVSREQMAVFIIRALYGETFSYTPTPYFTDVPASHWAFKYIQKLKELGITTGCGSGQYCPEETVTRDQMAAFLVRARAGEDFTCSSEPYFSDVPSSHWAFDYIQKLKELGITTGYGDGSYGPGDSVTRDQMAAFLWRAFLQ
jgi:hypothetical protein